MFTNACGLLKLHLNQILNFMDQYSSFAQLQNKLSTESHTDTESKSRLQKDQKAVNLDKTVTMIGFK